MPAGGLVDLLVINGFLFQSKDTAHIVENVHIMEYVGLFQIVFIKNGEENIAFEIDPDLFEGIALVGVVFVGGAGLQQIDIVCLEGICSSVYHQMTFSGEDELQNEIGGIGSADMKIGVGIGDAEAFNGEGDFLRAVINVSQHLVFQSGETGNILFSYMIKSGIFFHKTYPTNTEWTKRLQWTDRGTYL